MTNAEKLHTLKEHQAWRMGADGAPPLGGDISAAISYAIECCEAVQRIESALDRPPEVWYLTRSQIRELMEPK